MAREAVSGEGRERVMTFDTYELASMERQCREAIARGEERALFAEDCLVLIADLREALDAVRDAAFIPAGTYRPWNGDECRLCSKPWDNHGEWRGKPCPAGKAE